MKNNFQEHPFIALNLMIVLYFVIRFMTASSSYPTGPGASENRIKSPSQTSILSSPKRSLQ